MNELVDGPRELAASEKVTAIGDEQWHEINEAKKLVETNREWNRTASSIFLMPSTLRSLRDLGWD